VHCIVLRRKMQVNFTLRQCRFWQWYYRYFIVVALIEGS
jgi:hypothetical protein